MKEFKLAMRNATNTAQFSQLCKDTFSELNFEKRGLVDSMEVFNHYYNLNFSLLQLARMGRFIKSGEFVPVLSAYKGTTNG